MEVDAVTDSLDLQARKIIMASYLYYERNISLLTDAEFDQLCVVVAGELEWLDAMDMAGGAPDSIDPVRCIQLGSADELRTSGYHIKVTQLSVSGACAWYKSKRRRSKPITPSCTTADYKVVEVPGTSSGVLMRGLMG